LKKILVILSWFLLTNVSLAIDSVMTKSFADYSTVVFLLVFLIIFASAVVCIIKNCRLVLASDNVADKKSIAKKCLVFFVVSFAFLEIGKVFLEILFNTAGGFFREPNYIDFVFRLMEYIALVSIVVLEIIIELIKRKKITNDKLLHIISVISIILVSILSIILIVGLLKGDYYNTTYIPG